MPYIIKNGVAKYVPGVYFSTRVESSLPGPLPAFHIPVLLARGCDGHPYDVDSKLVTGEDKRTPFKLCNTDTAAKAYFGPETDIHKMMRKAKEHRLPFAYVANLSPMTRGSIIATATGPVNELTIYPRNFGPMGPWIKFKFASSIFTITPVKRYMLLGVNAGNTATRLYLAGRADWLTIGATVTIGGNTVAGVQRTITNAGVEITAAGQRLYWIEISSTVGSALNTSDYAVVLQYADQNEVSPACTTSQAALDWLNNFSVNLRAVKHADFTGAALIAVNTAAPIKEITAWGTRTAGTAPAPTSADVDAFIALMNGGEFDQFAVREQVLPQAYCLGMSDTTSHASMSAYAVAERARGFPISVMTGGAWGDVAVDASDSTNPEVRAATLNSQDVSIWTPGLDREAGYLSIAPAVWGLRCAGGPGHNLANDVVKFAELEALWDEINSSELSNLLKKGVGTLRLIIGSTNRYGIAQGLSTLQANAVAWNTEDATTYSLRQRDLADFIDRGWRQTYEDRLVGQNKIDRNAIASALRARAEQYVSAGYASEILVTSITLNSSGNGWVVESSVRPDPDADFFDHTTTILTGE